MLKRCFRCISRDTPRQNLFRRYQLSKGSESSANIQLKELGDR